ncbi:MAG: hypothetical protein ACK4OP_03655 [Gemmobacter sp.]
MSETHAPAKVSALSRRQLMGAAAALFAAPAILSRPALAQGRPMNFLTWGGRFGAGVREAFSDPFTAATGVAIEDITPYNYGRFITAMQNNNPENFDMAWFSDEVEPAAPAPWACSSRWITA